MDRICRIRKGNFIPQAREHEGNPGSAGRLTGYTLKIRIKRVSGAEY